MTEEEKSSAKVEDLAYVFACRITRLFQYLTEDAEYKEFIISKQIFRSGTSIGANLNEARHPQSDADFLSKANIALKEARETEYWLNLLHDNGYVNDTQFSSLNSDSEGKTVLVTGAAGFIGSNLVKRLFHDVKNIKVICIDSITDYYDVNIKYERLKEIEALGGIGLSSMIL